MRNTTILLALAAALALSTGCVKEGDTKAGAQQAEASEKAETCKTTKRRVGSRMGRRVCRDADED